MSNEAYLTKSRYVLGRACLRRLWRNVHKPKTRGKMIPGSPAHIGTIIGEKARTLFRNGVLVETLSHREAVSETARLVEDASVNAIFEAAFEFNTVRIRIDVLERLPGNKWRIVEVKSSMEMKDHHEDDVAVQYCVARGCGLDIVSVQLMHPRRDHFRGAGDVDWVSYFDREEKIADVAGRIGEVSKELDTQLKVLRSDREPVATPMNSDKLCKRISVCEHWRHCTKDMPLDWVQRLYRFSKKKATDLAARNIHAVADLPADTVSALTSNQLKQYRAIKTDAPCVSPDIIRELKGFGPPAYYLDFEFSRSALPLHEQMQTNELIAFQWSCHFVSCRQELMKLSVPDCMSMAEQGQASFHQEFLADGQGDPSHACARALLDCLGGDDYPILVHYASAERQAIESLAKRAPAYSHRLLALLPRLRDLQKTTEHYAFLPQFFAKPVSLDAGTYSIKTTAHAFDPEFDYANLSEIAKGSAASDAYYRLVTGEFMEREDRASLRENLLQYCKYDTTGMIVLHKGLIDLAGM